MYNSLSLGKIIGGLSKTLSIANQMIPLYKQVKPILTGSNNFFSNLNNVSNNIKNFISGSNNVSNSKQITTNSSNIPTFFQ